MKKSFILTSLLSFTTASLLFTGCGETQEAPASTSATPSSVVKEVYTPNPQTIAELEAISKEKMDLAIAYDKKYTTPISQDNFFKNLIP